MSQSDIPHSCVPIDVKSLKTFDGAATSIHVSSSAIAR